MAAVTYSNWKLIGNFDWKYALSSGLSCSPRKKASTLMFPLLQREKKAMRSYGRNLRCVCVCSGDFSLFFFFNVEVYLCLHMLECVCMVGL